MPTKAKRWAQKRNFTQYRLLGIISSLRNLETLTDIERAQIASALIDLNAVKKSFKSRNTESKQNYLKN